MDRQQLTDLQAPLKSQYREDPKTAVVTLHAEGALGEDITCSVQTGRALAVAGLHPATGGDGMSLCSGDMLLQALAACAGVTLRSVATAMEIELRDGTVKVEGDLDFRGTLAVDKEAPVGFRDIRLTFELDTDAPEPQVAKLIELTERYCVVLQTISGSARLSVDYSA
ncbi:OsmC family protein [Actinomadura barringtoniae]|uniref:OsmC family protein n=1 Tax=Actinomadura barringtoniae TaxID=1427535 RepID=A0A939PI11_9ACTN|nr:OsmC family protein [Actinomadura barringtoniae]MBO2453086.1 OsmC family protein [Actinomadura barringtoniae]